MQNQISVSIDTVFNALSTIAHYFTHAFPNQPQSVFWIIRNTFRLCNKIMKNFHILFIKSCHSARSTQSESQLLKNVSVVNFIHMTLSFRFSFFSIIEKLLNQNVELCRVSLIRLRAYCKISIINSEINDLSYFLCWSSKNVWRAVDSQFLKSLGTCFWWL